MVVAVAVAVVVVVVVVVIITEGFRAKRAYIAPNAIYMYALFAQNLIIIIAFIKRLDTAYMYM